MAQAPKTLHPDSDIHKGAVEDDASRGTGDIDESNTSMTGQGGHRNQPDEVRVMER